VVIRPEAAERTAAAVEDFAAAAVAAGASTPIVFGTFALRAARNPEVLLGRLSLPVRVLSGEEEARLGYLGAVAGLDRMRGVPSALVLDIGGGSVELSRGTPTTVTESHSVPLGCVLLTRRFLVHDPPHTDEVAALVRHVAQVLGPRLDRLRRELAVVVGVGGYLAGPVMVEAALVGIPTLLIEPNALPGFTNRALAPVVRLAA
jgi:exopolyphosphatase/guanosine-5'-triphosphate,3'-diphosphate pyrophosphatase